MKTHVSFYINQTFKDWRFILALTIDIFATKVIYYFSKCIMYHLKALGEFPRYNIKYIIYVVNYVR